MADDESQSFQVAANGMMEIRDDTLLKPYISYNKKPLWYISIVYPDAPCMVYLPTKLGDFRAMLVNIPYMEHMGISIV